MPMLLRECRTAPVLFCCKITVQFRLPYCPLNSIHVAKKIFILKINFKKENNYDYIFFLEIISQIFFSKFWVGGQKISFSTMCLDYKIYHFFLLILTLSLRYPFLLFLFIFFSGHRGRGGYKFWNFDTKKSQEDYAEFPFENMNRELIWCYMYKNE